MKDAEGPPARFLRTAREDVILGPLDATKHNLRAKGKTRKGGLAMHHEPRLLQQQGLPFEWLANTSEGYARSGSFIASTCKGQGVAIHASIAQPMLPSGIRPIPSLGFWTLQSSSGTILTQAGKDASTDDILQLLQSSLPNQDPEILSQEISSRRGVRGGIPVLSEPWLRKHREECWESQQTPAENRRPLNGTFREALREHAKQTSAMKRRLLE